jgi:hypothetical protein
MFLMDLLFYFCFERVLFFLLRVRKIGYKSRETSI